MTTAHVVRHKEDFGIHYASGFAVSPDTGVCDFAWSDDVDEALGFATREDAEKALNNTSDAELHAEYEVAAHPRHHSLLDDKTERRAFLKGVRLLGNVLESQTGHYYCVSGNTLSRLANTYKADRDLPKDMAKRQGVHFPLRWQDCKHHEDSGMLFQHVRDDGDGSVKITRIKEPYHQLDVNGEYIEVDNKTVANLGKNQNRVLALVHEHVQIAEAHAHGNVWGHVVVGHIAPSGALVPKTVRRDDTVLFVAPLARSPAEEKRFLNSKSAELVAAAEERRQNRRDGIDR